MNRIIAVSVLKDYEVKLTFKDGVTKEVDFRPLIGGGISSALLDKSYFKLVKIEHGGGIEWPNGMDFCPNFLKEYIPNKEMA